MPKATVIRKGKFDAAHFNPNIPGKCARMHGHTYHYEIHVHGKVDDGTGLVVDFRDMKTIMREHIEERLDHNVLNDVLDFPTSAENVARFIFHIAAQQLNAPDRKVVKVVLQETDDCRVEVTEDDLYD